MTFNYFRASIGFFFVVLSFFIPSIADATVLDVTDLDGNVTQVRNVSIDYTYYPVAGWYTPDFESSGIRAYQEEGITIVKWEQIEKLTIIGKNTDVAPSRLKAEVTLNGGQPKPLELRMDSSKGLGGETDIGDFIISLENVKHLVVNKETKTNNNTPVASSSKARVTGLEVTDIDGNVIKVKNVSVDYTSYPFTGWYIPYYVVDGILARQGKGVVTVKWDKIEKVTMASVGYKAEVTYIGGQSKTLDLIIDSKKGLFGEVDLGDFYIRLGLVKNIVVLKETKTNENTPIASSNKIRVAGLKLSDTGGNVVDVKDVKIDYTQYVFGSYTVTVDEESDGIRAFQGRGNVTCRWERIEKLTVIRKTTDMTPNRLKAEITLTGGQPKSLDLMMDSNKGLLGKTDIGEYSINLEKIKEILVTKETEIKK